MKILSFVFVVKIHLNYFIFTISFPLSFSISSLVFTIYFLQPHWMTLYYLSFLTPQLSFFLSHLISVIPYSIEIDGFDDKTSFSFYSFLSMISFDDIIIHFSSYFFASVLFTSAILGIFMLLWTSTAFIAFFYWSSPFIISLFYCQLLIYLVLVH